MGTVDAALAIEGLNGDYFKRCMYPEHPDSFWGKANEAKRVKKEIEDKKKAELQAKKEAQAKRLGVRIGMTTRQVREQTSWGAPEDMNTTTTNSATREQWVYGSGSYLYFTNGTLTAIQN